MQRTFVVMANPTLDPANEDYSTPARADLLHRVILAITPPLRIRNGEYSDFCCTDYLGLTTKSDQIPGCSPFPNSICTPRVMRAAESPLRSTEDMMAPHVSTRPPLQRGPLASRTILVDAYTMRLTS